MSDVAREAAQAEPGGSIELPDTVPPGFVRFGHALFGPSIPRVETFSMRGPARMRIGRGPRLPLRAATYHRIGRGFAAEFDMAVAGRTLVGGKDSFIDGRAESSVGGRRQPSSPQADQSANTFRWLEAGMLPRRGSSRASSSSRWTTSPCA